MCVDTTTLPVGGSTAGPKASRAVDRPVEPGNDSVCVHCAERIKFAAKIRHHQVIANVYSDGVWQRVEHFHAPCYAEAGEPFGAPGSREGTPR